MNDATTFANTRENMYPLKSTESISIYQNTTTTVHIVEHQTVKKMEIELIDSQQQSWSYIITSCGKAGPQVAQTSERKLHRIEGIYRFASDVSPHFAFTSPIF